MRIGGLIFLVGSLCAAGMAEAQMVEGTLLSDRWHYPFNGTPGARQNGSSFLSLQEEFSTFNLRDGMNVYKFGVGLPAELEGKDWEVAAATLTVWNMKDSAWEVGTVNDLGHPEQVELFAAGFGPTYNEADWAGTEAFIGGTAFAKAARDPFPRDLRTDDHVEENAVPYDAVNAPDGYTPWAVGVPVGYTPGAQTDAFPIVFELDVSDATVQSELRADVEAGASTWFLSSTYDLIFGGEPPEASIIPDLIMSEGVGNVNFGTSQQAPRLQLVLREVPGVEADVWAIF